MRKLVHRVTMCLGVLGLVLCASVSSAQPPDPLIGTWALNLAKSKYPPTFSDDGRTMTVTATVPLAQGKELTIVSVYEKQ
jgi:hypothetical protein